MIVPIPAKTWTKVADAGDAVLITAYGQSVNIAYSVNKPTITNPEICFQLDSKAGYDRTLPANLWFYTRRATKVFVNKHTDIEATD